MGAHTATIAPALLLTATGEQILSDMLTSMVFKFTLLAHNIERNNNYLLGRAHAIHNFSHQFS